MCAVQVFSINFEGVKLSPWLFFYGTISIAVRDWHNAGLLTGCAGAGPHNSIKAAQSRTISENLRNPTQYGKIWLKI